MKKLLIFCSFMLLLWAALFLLMGQINNGGGGGSGSGTVSANNGVTNAIATYAAAGGSTTVGPAANTACIPGATSGSACISAPAVAGTATNPFTLSNTILLPAATSASAPGLQFASAAQAIYAPAASTIDIVTGSNNDSYKFTPSAFAFVSGKGQHFNTQAAANDVSGTCTLSSGSCTITFTTAYTSAPACVAVPSTTGTFTTGATLKVAPTTANVVFTSTTGTDSAVIDYHCFGNPN
jgi:hypothetical protein